MKRSILYICAGFWLLFSACEREARIDLGAFETEIVVLANFSNADTLEVVVGKSQSVISQSSPKYVSDALVELYVDGFYTDQLSFESSPIPQIPGYYLSKKVVPEPGAHYRLVVEVPGFDPVEGACSMPFPVELDEGFTSALLETELIDAENALATIRIAVKVLDLPGVSNFYHLNFYQEGFDFQIDEDGDTLKTSFFSLPLVMESDDDQIPLIPYIESRGVLFSDEALEKNRGELSFTSTFQYRHIDQLLDDLQIELRSVSPEYFNYHRSLARQYQASPDPFSEPVILYSNIEGGQGVFAGFVPLFYRVHPDR
jgi:hypothetical protein